MGPSCQSLAGSGFASFRFSAVAPMLSVPARLGDGTSAPSRRRSACPSRFRRRAPDRVLRRRISRHRSAHRNPARAEVVEAVGGAHDDHLRVADLALQPCAFLIMFGSLSIRRSVRGEAPCRSRWSGSSSRNTTRSGVRDPRRCAAHARAVRQRLVAGAIGGYHHRDDDLAPFGILGADDHTIAHRGMLDEDILDFGGAMFSPPRMIVSSERPPMNR